MPVTVSDIRTFFRQETGRGTNDRLVPFARRLEGMPRQGRVAVIHSYGVEQFVRHWGERVDRKIREGHYRPASDQLAWRDQGRGWIERFAEGDRQILSALRAYEVSRSGRALGATGLTRLADLHRHVGNWRAYFEWYYQSEYGRSQQVVFSDSRANVAPFARWLLARWDRLSSEGDPLSQKLRRVGWYPPRTATDRDYVASYQVLTADGNIPPGRAERAEIARESEAARAGQRYFAARVHAYKHSLGQLGFRLMRHLFSGSYGGGIGETSIIHPLGPDEQSAFRVEVRTWGEINGSPGPSPGPGLPANGLPYGPPARPPAGLGGHKDRITAIYQIVVEGEGDAAHYRSAGIQRPHAGPPPYTFRWF